MARDGLPVSCPRARWCGPPLCAQPPLGRPPRQPQAPTLAVPEPTGVADARALRLAPGRRLRTRVAGVFRFLPLLARVHGEPLVSQAREPGSTMVPATRAWWSWRVLKVLDKERRRHLNALNCDEAVGLFAGLKVPPKQSYATAYASRTVRAHQPK